MHREISHADRAFGHDSRLSLYLLTGLLGVLVLADVWPFAARSFPSLPTWPNEVGGYRLALVAALIGGARVLYGALDGLMQGKLNADVALAVAVIAAILLREPLVAAEVVFIGLLGECLEDFTFARTKAAVRKLADLTPVRCWRLRDGAEERILVKDLAVGDVVVIKPGAKVPADGVVVAGASAVDVSALTGESVPADKAAGDDVLAGSLNGAGALTVEVRRVAEHTVLGQVVQLTAKALQDKAPIERSADRLARYFLPAVLLVAGVTFVGAMLLSPRGNLAASMRYAAYPMLSVLVVACPCALILATPAAVIAALGRLAGTGVLLKGGAALERLAEVDAFAFDKTGTLTEGRLEVGDVLPVGLPPEELLRLAASAERGSEHPLGRAVLDAAQGMALEDATDFLAHAGSGVSATVGGRRVLVGNRRLLAEHGVAVPPEAEASLDATGQTALLVALDGVFAGAIGARDRLRPEAAEVIEELRRLGVGHVAILTGDRAAAAKPVADALGVHHVHAGLLPADKAALLEAMPGKAAMVGDGVNDAPALAKAHVGLAIGGTGIDVAADAGDVLLLIGPEGQGRSPLRHLPFLLRLSRETVRLIRQNIVVFAFGVNAVGVVLTAWLPSLLGYADQGPLAAVIYHQLGSLLVLLNSMRLLWFERGGSWKPWLEGWNRRLDGRLDLDEMLHGALHRWREILGGLALVVLLAWGYSGTYAIGPDEAGVVRRFGRPEPGVLGPGLHLRWPWPVEAVERVKPDQVRTVEVGFRGGRGGGRGWSSEHGREAEEAVVLTGDGSLLEIQASVLYTVADPAVFIFDVARPDDVIRDIAESVLRELAGSRPMGGPLTAGRAGFQADARRRIEERLSEAHPYALGVRVEGLALHDVHPPQEVVGSYHEVTRARQRRDQLINLAKMNALTLRRRQEAEGLQLVRRAEAEKHERVAQAESRRAAFLARASARRLSWADEGELFASLLAGTLDREGYVRERKARVEANAALTDFRLYWETLTTSLAGRPKFLIDADGLPGRRTLWLVPPPAPTFLPRPRDEPRGDP